MSYEKGLAYWVGWQDVIAAVSAYHRFEHVLNKLWPEIRHDRILYLVVYLQNPASLLKSLFTVTKNCDLTVN